MANIRKLVEDTNDFLVQTRRHFHQHAELSSQEFQTNTYIKKYLDEWNIPYLEAGKTSIVATIKGGKPGKVLAMRGDFDALPILEATGLPFASENKGIMHACGHDFHGTYMLGAAKILKSLQEEIPGTIKLIFQEGEEIGAGAREIIAAHLVDDVENIVALHVSSEYDLGKYTLNYGIMSAHGSGAVIDIKTKGGKLSEPENGKNALLAASDLINSFTSLLPQYVSAYDQAVFVPTVLKVTENKNGIPSRVHLEINFRTYDLEVAKILDAVAQKAAKGIALSHDAEISVECREPSTSVNNDKESTDRAAKIIERLHGKEAVIWEKPATGGENFSRFQEKIPGVFIHIGAITNGVYRAHHTDKTDFDEKVLADGLEFLLEYAFTYLNE